MATRTEEPRSAPTPEHDTPDRPRGRRSSVVATMIVVVLVAPAGVRFATASGGGDAPPAPAPATLTATIATMEARVADAPGDLAALQSLAIAYVQRAIESGDPAFYDLAERTLDDADELAPDHPTTLLARATLALSLHEFETARDLGERARQAAPASAGPLGVLVDAAVELGEYDEAAAVLQDMVDTRPDLAALSRVSYLRELSGDLPGAIQAMAQAEEAGAGAPFDEATVAALLGDLHLDAGDLDAAAAAYDRALTRSPGLVAAEVGRGRVTAARGDAAAAIARLEEVVAARPQPAALLLLGDLQRATGDNEAAAATDEVVRSVTALQEAAGQVVDLELALFEADRGENPELAVDLATAAAATRPDNIFVADTLAWALHRAGRSDEAAPHVATALRGGTTDPLVRFHAAAILAEIGDTETAHQHLEIVTRAPWFSFGHLDDAGALAADLGLDAPAAWTSWSPSATAGASTAP
jgi:tetratricopeptide (TPR) repeat protein